MSGATASVSFRSEPISARNTAQDVVRRGQVRRSGNAKFDVVAYVAEGYNLSLDDIVHSARLLELENMWTNAMCKEVKQARLTYPFCCTLVA
jgi:hypothetical protein